MAESQVSPGTLRNAGILCEFSVLGDDFAIPLKKRPSESEIR